MLGCRHWESLQQGAARTKPSSLSLTATHPLGSDPTLGAFSPRLALPALHPTAQSRYDNSNSDGDSPVRAASHPSLKRVAPPQLSSELALPVKRPRSRRQTT